MADTQLIKDKIDVVDLISEYVQLKPAGVNHKGLCPFHQEKTPSFMVNRERQSWHCFGCNKGGDIFTFIEEMEGMEFVEALKYLADRAGVQIDTFKSDVNKSQKNRIKEINKEAARFFHNFLLKMDASKAAREYLENRGLKQETIEDWQIGFVTEQWDLLTQYLLKKGHSIDDLVAAGLTIKREGADVKSGRGFYDRFRGRIMFPIWDLHGEVVGFTGRVLVEKENSGGKYVNTPQTLVYDKSRVIFGLNKAKKEIKSEDLIVMVEGQTDVIACHRAGMKNVVASSGTALTQEQVKLLKRYSSNMNMAFDADEAGQKAAKRGIDIAIAEGMNVKVIKIPDGYGKDPDECIKKDKQVWFDSVKNAQGVMDWYFDKVFTGKDLTDLKQKQIVADELLKEIALIPYAVEREHWLKELGSKLGVEVGVLREDMLRVSQKSKVKSLKPEKITEEEEKIVEKGRLDLLFEQLFALVFKLPKLIDKLEDENLGQMLSTGRFADLYQNVKKEYNDGIINFDNLRGSVQAGAEENTVDVLLMKGELDFSGMQEDEAEKEFKHILEQIQGEWIKDKRKKLQIEIEQAEKSGNADKLAELIGEFQKL